MTTQPNLIGRKPDFRLYSVHGDGDNAKWTPIGAAWEHRDGKGFTLQCDAMPLGGRIVMRTPKDQTEADAA